MEINSYEKGHEFEARLDLHHSANIALHSDGSLALIVEDGMDDSQDYPSTRTAYFELDPDDAVDFIAGLQAWLEQLPTESPK